MATKDAQGNLHDDNNGRFTRKENSASQADKLQEAEKVYNSEPKGTPTADNKKKMPPAEKIASVHIDFNKDNILPELNEEDLVKVGSKVNKPVLLKKNVIDKNIVQHNDLTDKDFESIIAYSLYSPSEIFKANAEKPYYHFAKVIEVNSKGKPEIGLALLDVDDNKDNFEVV
ncbi:MAG: hypothetical protein K2N30_04360, partial [Clostridia bacterium]|nr:hypothetical protein [Clostridia bacterium]